MDKNSASDFVKNLNGDACSSSKVHGDCVECTSSEVTPGGLPDVVCSHLATNCRRDASNKNKAYKACFISEDPQR